MPQSEPGRPWDETAASMMEALFTRSPVGLHLLDTDLRVVRVNTATTLMRDFPVSELLGRPVQEVYDVLDDDVEATLRGVLETGETVRQRVVQARMKGSTTHPRYFGVTALRLENRAGTVLGLAVTTVDVTERQRARERGEVLGRVRRKVGRTLDPMVTGEELAEALVPAFADVAVVEVVDAVVRGDDPPLAPLPSHMPLMRTAFRSTQPMPPEAHPVGDVRALPAPTPFTQAMSDLHPRLVQLEGEPEWFAVDPARASAIRMAEARSLITVPLSLRGTVLGLLSLYRRATRPAFDENDRRLAAELAAHTSLCTDNARRFTREHTVAATVQRQLLPSEPESHAPLETAYLSVTGADPGSWYDTIALSGARTALVVGNVSGRGLNAAATMGQLRTAIRSLAAFDLSPDELLARLHDTTAHLAAERARLPLGDPLRREALAADCVYAIHDPLTSTCELAGAGRLAPLVVLPDGRVEVPDSPSGPRLGTGEDAPFATVRFDVPDGSVLVFASDPVISGYLSECPGPLHKVAEYRDRPLQELCDAIVYTLPQDLGLADAAVIVARVRSFPADRVAVWDLDVDPASVAVARKRAREQLLAWQLDEETTADAELIISELVTNAVRHGSPPLRLRLVLDRTLTCEVLDGGTAAPHLRHAKTVDEGGRGLFITAQLARTWGTRYSDRGKTIWTEQALPQSRIRRRAGRSGTSAS